METATPPPINPIEPKKSKWKKRLFISIIVAILLFICYVFICGFTYSDGTRTGVVIKVSKKGYVFKTYEGELNLGGFSQGDGTIMQKNVWLFSIQKNDMDIYNQITQSQGKQVRLHYKEVYKHFFWQSETSYFIEKIEVVK
jgi:hypothetical protein